MRSILASLSITILTACCAPIAGDPPPAAVSHYIAPVGDGERTIFLISDSHMGFGRDGAGNWSPTEDFRWPRALASFLEEAREAGEDRVDLIIVGDFLEMWQVPDMIACTDGGADLGCTVPEMAAVVRGIVAGHTEEFDELRKFAEAGNNRLHIIPGNHDAALLIADVWRPLGEAFNEQSGRINLVTDGLWVSGDGRIIVEHGHQIGSDVNKYDDWPGMVVKADRRGTYRMIRPWGENFVQSVFNEVEAGNDDVPPYPIVDNLAPETAAVRYRMADVGIGQSIADAVRFLVFNLLETSLVQKLQVLGPQTDPMSGQIVWDVEAGREMGHMLFANALADDDPFRALLLGDTAKAAELREALSATAMDESALSDDEVRSLCEQLAARNRDQLCIDVQLGAAIEAIFSSRPKVVRQHLIERRKTYGDMTLFIYGHTHKYEIPHAVSLPGDYKVTVVNTGAFQRVVGEEAFLERVAEKSEELGRDVTPGEGLRLIDLSELAPCYTYVEVRYRLGLPEAKLWYWRSDETDAVPTGRRSIGSNACR
ncbi:MAG: metallophosphoesterase [Rhodospirillales bacterium]